MLILDDEAWLSTAGSGALICASFNPQPEKAWVAVSGCRMGFPNGAGKK